MDTAASVVFHCGAAPYSLINIGEFNQAQAELIPARHGRYQCLPWWTWGVRWTVLLCSLGQQQTVLSAPVWV